MPQPGETVPLEYAGKIYQVPVSDAQARVQDGFREVSPEQLEAYDRKKEYQATHSPVVQAGQAAATGAAAGALSVPALATKLLTGDEHSGHKWTAKVMAGVKGETEEDMERDLRVIQESSPAWHTVGEFAGSMAATGGAMGLGKAALSKAATKGVAGAAAALEGGAALPTAMAAESAVSSVAMVNEEMFVEKQEMTAEMAVLAATLGALGPLGMYGAGRGAAAVGRKVAGKVDDIRLGRHTDNLSKHADEVADIEARYADDVAKRDAKVGEIDEKEFARQDKAYQKGVKEKKKVLEKRQKEYAKINDEIVWGSLDWEARRAARRAAIDKSLPLPKGPKPTGVKKPYPDAIDRPEMPGAPQKPFEFKRLFGDKRLEAAAEGMERGEATFLEWAQEASSRAGDSLEYGARRAGRGAFSSGRSYRGSRSVERGALIGALTGDAVGAVLGGVGAKIVERFGPAASGFMFKQMSNVIGGMARKAAKAAERGGTKKINKLAVAGTLGHRLRATFYTEAAFDDTTRQVDNILGNPVAFGDDIGTTFGGFNDTEPGMVPAITNNYIRGATYLKEQQPQRVPLYPAMPQMGLSSVPVGDREVYMRKARAVMNPLTILEDLADGTLTRDAVEAVKEVYPALYLNMQSEAMQVLSEREAPLPAKQAMLFDSMMGGQGMVYNMATPAYMARVSELSEASKAMGN